MKTTQAMLAVAVGFLLAVPMVEAQGFDSGSDGSDGDFTTSGNATLDVPDDGVFNFGTFSFSGGTLTFNRNALNTPVYILATGDITVGGNILVDGQTGTSNPPVGGAGGPGGFDGGDPGIQDIPPGAGNGPGGGEGGRGDVSGSNAESAGAASHRTGTALPSPLDGEPYGSPLQVPIVGGSGGGGASGNGANPGQGGGGGGGAIVLASNTRIVITGGIYARGGNANFPHPGNGSGGAIRLVAPIVSGTGVLNVTGGSQGFNDSGGDRGGHGYIRIDTIDRTGLNLNYQPNSSVFTAGTFMTVFPPIVPKLDVIEVAGETIAAGSPAQILLPFGSDPNRTIVIRGTDFSAAQPIDVVLVPASGPRQVYEAELDMSTNPDEVTVSVEFPINTRTRVWAWTR